MYWSEFIIIGGLGKLGWLEVLDLNYIDDKNMLKDKIHIAKCSQTLFKHQSL